MGHNMERYKRLIQDALKSSGFYDGNVDGIVGPKTYEAVMKALGKPLSDTKSEDFEFSDKGMELLKEFEGFRSAPYQDAVGVWTIGYGNTYYRDGKRVTKGDKPLSKAEAHELKKAIVSRDFAPAVRSALRKSRVHITQEMFDACVSLAYNIGVKRFAQSSIVRYLEDGSKVAAADAFRMYNRAGGRVLSGLVNRREKERTLFLS